MKLFSKNSNLYDHNPPTLQSDREADGRTDRQTTRDRNTALCTKVHRAVKTVICLYGWHIVAEFVDLAFDSNRNRAYHHIIIRMVYFARNQRNNAKQEHQKTYRASNGAVDFDVVKHKSLTTALTYSHFILVVSILHRLLD